MLRPILLLLKARIRGGALSDLFAAPVQVRGHTTKEGVFVAPHQATRRKRRPETPTTKPTVTEPAADLVREHERLVTVLRSPSHADDQAEAAKQEKELREYERVARQRSKPAEPDGPDLFSAAAAREAAAPPPPPEAPPAPPPPAAAPPAVASSPAPELPSQQASKPASWQPPAVFGVAPGTSKGERRKLNAAAVAILKAKPSDADLTSDDLAALARYTGTGGVGTSLNEFYTPEPVAAAMWTLLRAAGFRGGTVLEPCSGTGVFLRTAPDDARVTAAELSPISGRICRVLNPRHEVRVGAFERFATTDGRLYDAVIGNPPFGVRGALVKDDKPDIGAAEQYFLDTMLDKTTDGGLCAVIVPSTVADARNGRAFRDRILRKAAFVGGFRMPTTAFEAAHTTVTTDVLLFRKRPADVAGALSTVEPDTLEQLGLADPEWVEGRYFTGAGAAHVMGAVGTDKRSFGDIYAVHGSMVGVPEAIAAWRPPEERLAAATAVDVPAVLEAIGDDPAARRRAVAAALKPAYQVAQVGDVKVIDGVRYVLTGEPPRWHRADGETPAAVEDALPAADLLDDLAEGRARDPETVRTRLIAALDAYVREHGIPAQSRDLRAWIAAPSLPPAPGTDPDAHAARVEQARRRVAALLGAVGDDGVYSDLVTGRVRETERLSVDTAAETLALKHGGFTVDELAGVTGRDRDDLLDHLLASPAYAVEADGQTWTTRDLYLSGELWPKLDAARAALAHGGIDPAHRQAYERQARALEETIAPQSLDDVEIQLGSGFITPADLTAWFAARAAAWRERNPTASWSGPPAATLTYQDGAYVMAGAGYNRDLDLIERSLNRRGVKKDERERLERITREFRSWLLASDRREAVEERYNRQYRGFRPRAYSDEPMALPGLNPDRQPNRYQWPIVRWALEAGKGILAADVGLGKTVQALLLTRMAKASGSAKRPVIVVPKSVAANWQREAEMWFPGARCLVIGETYSTNKAGELVAKADDEATRRRKLHELRQTDYDFVFITQPAWNAIDLDPEVKARYQEDDFWVQRSKALEGAGAKRATKIREQFEQAKAQREFRDREDTLTFDQLGVDMLVMDEGHCFPAGTLVDGRAIENYRTGDIVNAFDHASGRVVRARVANLQVRRPTSLFRVTMDDGATIVCTGKHPFFTQDGYVFAENLRAGDYAFKNLYDPAHGEENMEARRAASGDGGVGVRLLPNLNTANEGAGLAPARTRPDPILLREAVRYALEVGAAGYHAKTESWPGEGLGGLRPPGRAIQSGRGELDGQAGGSCEDQRCVEGIRSETEGAWREWRPDAIAAGSALGGAWRGVGSGVGDQDWLAATAELPDALQDRLGEPDADAGRGSGRRVAPIYYAAGPRPEEGGILARVRVARVQVLEPGCDGTFGGLCPGGVVFNIEVERHHNYFAEGILVHNSFKNLFGARNRFGMSPKFLGAGNEEGSKRAHDTVLKSRWVREQNGGRGVYMLTATPTKNSPLEIYNMLAHIAPEAFDRLGIKNAEDFIDRFVEFTDDRIIGTSGQLEDALVTSGFKNLDELRELMRRFIDRKTAADVGLVIPSRDDRLHTVDMTAEQERVYQGLRAEAEASKNGDENAAHIFSIMDRMGKATIDLELLGDAYQGQPSPKIDAAADQIAAGIKDGGQVVFCEALPAHEKLIAGLVKRGIPRDQIGLVNAQAAPSGADRQRIADAFNSGRLKVVIGNRTMEEGMNLQKGATDIHHLDLPWEPASLQQRNGRAVRQGNTKSSVRIHTYLAKRSFDAYRWQTVISKKDWQDLLWNGGDRVENLMRFGMSQEDMQVMFAADPEAARKKIAEDKEAARLKAETEGRGRAADLFAKLQQMRRSLAGLRVQAKEKGKEPSGPAVARLEYRIGRLRDDLRDNKHFAHKALLDGEAPAIVTPTGRAFAANTGFELQPGPESPVRWSDQPTRWVVTSVDPETGEVSARQYGTLSPQTITTTAATLDKGSTPFGFDATAEAAELRTQQEAAAKAAAEAKTQRDREVAERQRGTWEGVRALPPETLAEMAPQVQAMMKDSVRGYRDGSGSAPYGLIGPDGQPVIVPGYDARKKIDTHDLMLPLPEHRQKAIEGYVAMQEGRTYKTRYAERRGRRSYGGGGYASGSATGMQPVYSGFEYDSTIGGDNPWRHAMARVFGPEVEGEAVREVRRRAAERIAAAPDFKTAMLAAAPTVQVTSYQPSYTQAGDWPEATVRALRQAAERLGVLDQQMGVVATPDSSYRSAWHPHLMDVRRLAAARNEGLAGQSSTVREWLEALMPSEEGEGARTA